MKKIISLLLVLTMVFTVAACSNNGGNDAPVDNTPTVTEKTYKLGMGVVVGNSSKDEQAQTDSTVVALVTDEEGKIVAAAIDVAQNKMPMDAVDSAKEFKSKQELLFDYNMKNASPIGKEWFEQAAGYCEWLVGKTVADVKGQTTEEKNGHQVSTDAELYASCTMQVTDFFAATVKAFEDEQGKTFTTAGEFTLGLGVTSTAADSTEDVIKMYSDFGAVVVADGKALAAVCDAIQPQVDYTSGSPEFKFNGTKRELKEGYNMVKFAEDCNNEWYQQSAAFTDYVVGLTAADVAGIATRVRGESEPHAGYVVVADETLFASCSIQINGFQGSLAKAFANAK